VRPTIVIITPYLWANTMANTVCIFNQLRGWPISLQLFVCIFYQVYCHIINLWSIEIIQTTPFIIGLLCTGYLQKWGVQNVLLKFCGGHAPPGPPGSNTYDVNLAKNRDKTFKNILCQNIIPCFLTFCSSDQFLLSFKFLNILVCLFLYLYKYKY